MNRTTEVADPAEPFEPPEDERLVIPYPAPPVERPAPGPPPREEPPPAPEAEATRTDSEVPPPPRTRALPVMVLGLLVAVIFAGVTWSIVAGDDPSSERAQPGDSPSSTTGRRGQATRAPDRGGLTAVENSAGAQLDWDGNPVGDQVVLVLSTTEPPHTLPADTGTALLVPSEELDPGAGYCFAVVPAPDPLPPASELAADLDEEALRPEACIGGATATTVRLR